MVRLLKTLVLVQSQKLNPQALELQVDINFNKM